MNKLMTALGIAVSGLLLWLAVKDTDFAQVAASFRGANVLFAAPLLLGLAGFYFLKAARWSDILSPAARFTARELLPAVMSGAAGNNLLPAHMGELVRIYLLGREFRLSKAGLLATLIVERVFDVVGVLLLLCGVLFSANAPASLRPAVLFLLVVAVAGATLIYLMAGHSAWLMKVFERHGRRLPPAARGKAATLVGHIASGFGALRERRLFYRILANSVLQWLLMSACVHFALRAFAIDVPYHAAIVVLTVVVAGLTLPTSPGFVGTIQYCFVLGLTPFGVDSSRALAASIFYHTLLWFAVTGTGLYFLHKYRITFAEVRELERHRLEPAQPGSSDTR